MHRLAMHVSSDLAKRIALERIEILFTLAYQKEKSNNEEDIKLAKRYTSLLKRISMHYKVPIPRYIKNSICKNCGAVLIPGKNCSVRLASSKRYVVYKCECGKEKHIHYK